MLTFWSSFLLIVCAVGLVLSIFLMRRQQRREMDRDANRVTSRHPILANPILIAYVLFHVLVVVGFVILYNYF